MSFELANGVPQPAAVPNKKTLMLLTQPFGKQRAHAKLLTMKPSQCAQV